MNELYHHGTKGQKWGVRKYQNSDGSLTPAGRERYNKGSRKKQAKDYQKHLRKIDKELQRTTIYGNMLAYKANKYGKKAYIADKSNETEKAKKYTSESKRMINSMNHVQKYQDTLIKDMENTVRDLRKNGYAYKVDHTKFNQPAFEGKIKKILKDAGSYKLGDLSYIARGGLGYDVNASSGNKITVRDAQSLSNRKRSNWETKWEAQRYRPQRVIRTYY